MHDKRSGPPGLSSRRWSSKIRHIAMVSSALTRQRWRMYRAFRTWPIGAAAGCCFSLLVHPAIAQSSKSPQLTAPTATQPTTTTPPASLVGTPMTSAPPIAPLSPQLTTTPLSGGTVRNDKLPSPSALSTSPSESTQSTAGGGGWGLKECMRFWDRGTHMSKSEWRGACQRSAHRLDNLKIDDLTLGLPEKPANKRPRT